MELGVREVASLLGRSPRTIRSQVARGEIVAHKRGGRWRIPSEGGAQRRALQARADEIRAEVDAALPSRVGAAAGQRRRSLADLDVFLLAEPVLRALREAAAAGGVFVGGAVAELEAALLDLAEGVHARAWARTGPCCGSAS